MKKTLISCLAWCGLASACLGAGGAPVVLDWGVVDTSSAAQQKQSRAIRAATLPTVVQQVNSRGGAPWLVQFNDVIQEEWKTALVEAGAELKGYIPENAFLVEATPTVVAKIGAMSNVTWVGEYLPSYKKAKSVRQMLARGVEETREYNVILFQPEDRVSVARAIAELSGAFVTVVEELPDAGLVRAILPAAALETVSGWGEVQWVEPYSKPRLWNNIATRTNLMNISNVWSVLGLTGAGQTIAVCDTGLDSGNTSTLHPDFTNRVTGFGWSNGAYSASYSWADLDAHGTHVSGSVLGNGTMSAGLYKGVAYEANLIIQGTQTNLSGIPSALATLFKQAFDNGARIHSDSWGYDDHGYYNTDSRALDQFVWSNKTMLILVAAGNSGTDSNTVDGVIDPMSVASPATAKNCMTVGAAENYRTTGGYSSYTWGSAWPDDYSAAPVSADYVSRPMSNNVQGMAAFSSRGPCNDGRIKPDIVAPGTDIISTRSRRATSTGWGTVTGNTNYIYEGGTSMATPLTAGAAGLTRQWVMTTGGITNPSGQLLKALMLNGARNMAPGQYLSGTKQEIPTARPNNVQGWGHVDLFNTLQPATNQFLTLIDTNSLSTGQTNTFTYVVNTASTNKFILTMAYADYWGTAGSGKILVNDLDLTVRKPSSTMVYANSRTNLDATNNVEMIEFAADEVGTYTVRVAGRTVPSGGSQAYALVVRGPVADETPTAPAFGANPGPVSATVGVATNFTVATTNGYPAPVLALRTTTASSGYSFTAGSGQLTYTPPVGDGGLTRTFTFTASNSTGVATQTVSVIVAVTAPVAPSSIWASATNSLDFTAAWSAASGATSYQLDVATNSSFSGGGGAGTNLVSEGFASATPSGWTISAGGTYSSSPYVGSTLVGTYSIKFSLTGNSAVTPAFVTGATNLQFWAYGNGGSGSTFAISGLVNSVWTLVNTVTVAQNGATYTVALNPQTTQVGFYFTKVVNCALDDVIVQAGGAGSPSFVPGYSNRTVAGTSQSVTGLTSGATYSFRARAVNAAGSSPNSPTGSVTTTGGIPGTPPILNAITAQSAMVNEDFEYTVSATTTEGDPILSYACTSAVDTNVWEFDEESGYLYFLPQSAQIGANGFSFTATDKDGASSPVAMTVTVSAASTPPTVSFGASRVYAEEGGSTVTLPVTLSFAADATVQVAIAGTALPDGTDFNCSTTILFSASGSASSNWALSVVDDSLAEGPESASLRLNPVSGATLGTITQAVFFIRDNDAFSILAGNITSGVNQEYEDPGERILQALCPDVALLQEFLMTNGVTYRAWVNEHFGSNFYYFVESTNGDSAAAIPNGIVSRWPITASNEWEDVNLSNRDFAWAKIDLPGTRDLYAVSVHLKADSGSESDRTAQARVLTNNVTTNGWLTNGYVVIGGDFNLQNRSETALSVLTSKVVSDAHQPADQFNDKETNSGRDNPYDLVLPSTNLNARHRAFSCYGYTFTNGMVFDTRITWANDVPPPALTNDSGATNMQHMAVVKVFELEATLEAPSSMAATPAGRTQLDVSWNPNSVGDSVIVVWNTTGSFSSPTGTSPAVGAAFAGGTVLSKGTATSASHTGLSGCSTYFYRAWSYLGTNYSAGVEASAVTTGPDAPSTVWASATNTADFTAAWSAVSGATEYRIDVSANPNFSSAGGSVYVADFEDATKAGFAAGDVSLNGLSWNLNEVVVGTSGSDRFNGLKSARARSNETVNAGIVSMNSDTNMGLSAITLQYAVYGSDGSSTGRVDYSTDSGTHWISAGTFAATSTNLTLFTATNLNVTGNVRVRVVKTSGTSVRYNLDDITLYPYASADAVLPTYSNRVVSGSTSVLVTGLTAGMTYYFQVRAVEGSCESENSSVGQVTTRAQENQSITAFVPTNGSVFWATNTIELSATASSGLPVTFSVGSGPATLSAERSVTFTGAGSVSIVASQAGNGSWNPAPDVTNTFTVMKASAGVVLNGLVQTYNGAARTVTATTTPNGLTVNVTYDGLETAPTGVGSYAVTGTVSDAVYQGLASGTMVVSKAHPTVTAWPTASAIPYGQTLAHSTLIGGSATPVGSFAFTSPSATPGGGTRAQSVTYTPNDMANYNTTEGAVNVTVSPVALTVAADKQIKPVGAANPVLTVTYTGFVLGQTSAALATEPTASTDVNEATPIGIYANAITVSGGVSAEYTFTYIPADFTVTEAIESGDVSSNDVELVVGPLEAGMEYELLYRSSLTTGEWMTVDAVTGSGETNATLTHNGGGTNEVGYYRIDGVVGPSAEVWGFVKMTKPGQSKLAMVGVPFSTEEQTLNSLMNPLQFSGDAHNPSLADQVILWNVQTQKYKTYSLYDLRAYEGYETYVFWQEFENFGWGKPACNPVLATGSAIFMRGSTTGNVTVTLSGEVVLSETATQRMEMGMQLVSNPFSDTVKLSDLKLHESAKGDVHNPSLADQIIAWNEVTQKYVTYSLYDLREYEGYESYVFWQSFDNFGWGRPTVDPTFEPGRGFWFRAVNRTFDWMETNKYKSTLE